MKKILSFLMSSLVVLEPILSLDYAFSDPANSVPILTYSDTKQNTEAQKVSIPFKLGGDCGPKVLQKILLTLRKTVSLEKLIAETQTIKGQTNLEGMRRGANQEGLWALGVKTDIQTMQKLVTFPLKTVPIRIRKSC